MLPRSTPNRSPPSVHRPPPLFIPDSPLRRLSKLTLEQVAALASQSDDGSDTDDNGDRWSIPIFLADDASPAGFEAKTSAYDDETPRQLLYLPTAVSGDGDDKSVRLSSSPFLDTSTPRRLPACVGPRTPPAGRSPIVDRKVSAGSAGSDESTWSPPSPSEVVNSLVMGQDVLADGTAIPARRNRHARGPEDSIWRHCSPLRSKSDPDLPGPSSAGQGLFDPGYSLDAHASAAPIQRDASPFESSEDNDQSQLSPSLRSRCPSPLDSTFMAVLSRPPVNVGRASFTSKMAAHPTERGELRLIVWMEDDKSCTFSGSLPFCRYYPPATDHYSGTSAPTGRMTRVDRFESTGCVEYAARPGLSPVWTVQPESEDGPSELRLIKITFSDDDRRNFVAASTARKSGAPRVSLDDFGSFELAETDAHRPQWVLRYEIGIDSEDTTITLLSFKCDPDLLDRSRAADSGKGRSGGGFRRRLGPGPDASSRSSPLAAVAQRRLHLAPSNPEVASGLKLRPAASESRLTLLRSPLTSPAPSASSSPRASSSTATLSTFSLFGRKRSLSSARADLASGLPTVAPRRSHSLRSTGSLHDGFTSGSKLLARDALNRSSAPLPFLPSSIASGDQVGTPRVRSSPGQGLPASFVAPPRQPSTAASSKRRPATGSPSKGANVGLSAEYLCRQRHATSGPSPT